MAEDRSVKEGAPELPLARAATRRRRARDAAAALQLLGAALFATPFVDVFGGAGRVFGLPAGALLLFVAWFGLIGVAAWLARRDGGCE